MTKLATVSASPLTTPNYSEFSYESFEEAFPKVDPGVQPCGYHGVFQIRHPKRQTKGGIILAGESKSTEHYNTQIAKVISLGPLCWKSVKEIGDGIHGPKLDVLTAWPEGPWFSVGDYVRVPKYSGDRFFVPFLHKTKSDPDGFRDQIIFALFRVKDVLGKVSDPLVGMAYLD